jgi:polysaccharide export outer membrane protein
MNQSRPIFLLLLLALVTSSCQQVFFKVDKKSPVTFDEVAERAMENYRIAKFDQIAISVYTNKGEELVDPLGFMLSGQDIGAAGGGNNGGNGLADVQLRQLGLRIPSNQSMPFWFNVDHMGEVNLPQLGNIKLEGLTLREADSLLSREYHDQGYYIDAYVSTQYINKRVFLVGALGEQVIPLNNENMTLIEILALASQANGALLSTQGGGLQRYANVKHIQLIRNWGQGESLQVANVNLKDLGTLMNGNLYVQPNDIIYVSPRRRIDRDTVADLSTIISAVSSLVTVYLLINSLGN